MTNRLTKALLICALALAPAGAWAQATTYTNLKATGTFEVDGAAALDGVVTAGSTILTVGGVRIGSAGTLIEDALSTTTAVDIAEMLTLTTADSTGITITGAAVNDVVILGPPADVEAGVVYTGFVSAANTVKIRSANVTTGTINPASKTWRITVLKY